MTNITKKFIKPEINFPVFPTIFMYIDCKYRKVQTYSDFVGFINNCFNEADISKNEVRRQAYQSVASALYSTETNTSYESKNIELLVRTL